MTELMELVEQARNTTAVPDDGDIDRFIMPHPLAADHHPAAVHVALVSKNNTRNVIGILNKIANYITGGTLDATNFSWGNLRYRHVMKVRQHMSEQYKPGYVNQILAHLRSVSLHAHHLGQMSADDYLRIKHVKNVPSIDETCGRSVSKQDIERLFMSFPDTLVGDRDRAVVALLYGCGLRRSEICKIRTCDYERDLNRLRVFQKRGRIKYTYLSKGVKKALDLWINYHGDITNFKHPLFWSLGNKESGGDRKKLHPDSVYRILKRSIENAGIKTFSPHDLRRTYCTNLLENNVDIAIVQRLMGHKSVETTIRYDRRGEEAKQKAVEMLDDIPITF